VHPTRHPTHPAAGGALHAGTGVSGRVVPEWGDVAIGAADDAQSVVNAHGPGTTYIVKAGTHLRNFSVQPNVLGRGHQRDPGFDNCAGV
jgi:hypothetical protein